MPLLLGRPISHLVDFRLSLQWFLEVYAAHISLAQCQSLYFIWKFNRNQHALALPSSEDWNIYSLKNHMRFYLFLFLLLGGDCLRNE